jgi:hypothetical protein
MDRMQKLFLIVIRGDFKGMRRYVEEDKETERFWIERLKRGKEGAEKLYRGEITISS